MLLPITLVWNVQMRARKKLAFMGLFSLSILTMIVAIIRTINVNSVTSENVYVGGTTFLWTWTNVQVPLGMLKPH